MLFADLTGYTALSKLLDAGEIEGILTMFFEAADAAVVEYAAPLTSTSGSKAIGSESIFQAFQKSPLFVEAQMDGHSAAWGIDSICS